MITGKQLIEHLKNHKQTDLDRLLTRYVFNEVNEVERVRIETWFKASNKRDRERFLTDYEERDLYAKMKVHWN